MKNLINLILSLFITYSSLGQIKGKIVDDKQQAASFANVLVLNTKDSSLVKGEAADVDGKFEFTGLKPQAYLLQVSAVGFQKSFQIINLESGKTMDVGTIQLKAETQTLGEVQVTARKQLIERDGDKMIMNVEASPTAAGLNGLELMEKVPGVTVDRNTETIKLKGKDGVLIMIDDRKTYLTDEQLANFLKTLKSEDIEKIEIIANPSARFDASGSSGIINIKTKKGKNFGTNYTLDLNAGYSHYKGVGGLPKNGQGLTINSRREKYVIFGNINRQYAAWYNSEDQVQNLLSETGSVLEKRVITGLAKGNFENWSAKIGFDYDLSKKTTVGFSGQWSNTFSPMERSYNQQSVTETIRQSLLTERNREATFDNYTFNTHLKQKIDTSGTELTVDFDVILNSKSWDDKFVTTTTQNDASPSVANNQILFPANGNTFVLKADFIKKLTAKTKIETGVKASYSKKTNDFSDNFRDNGALVSSFFKFNELISAGYVMINSELTKSLSIQAGLRAEQTNNQGLNREGNKLTQQDYLNLFPTLTLNQKVSKDYAISLGYSRRINRPNDDVFNTFKRFFSPQSYVAGNPTILPSLNNTISLTNTIKDKYSFSLNYVSVNQFSTEVFDVDSVLIPGRRVIRESMENVNGKIGWWSVDASVPFNPTKWWSVNLNIWGGINVYNYKRESTVVDISQLYHGAYMQHTFTLNKTLSGEISGWYNSGETWGFQTSKPQGGLDFGLKKMLWDKKATVKFLVQDPFNFNSFRNNVETTTLTGVGTYRWDNRRFRISLTYNFGNTNVKQAIQSNDGGNGGGGGPSKN